MEHWFDGATKSLAQDGGSRRELLKTAALAGMAFLLPRTSWAQPSPGAGACLQTSAGGKRTVSTSASTTFQGQALTLTSTVTTFGHQRWRSGTIYQRVDLGGKLLYEMTYDFVPGFKKTTGGVTAAPTPLARLEANYEPPIVAPRHVILRWIDGAAQGFVDGHVFLKDRFTVNMPADLQESVRGLLASASSNLSRCGAQTPKRGELSPTIEKFLQRVPFAVAMAQGDACAQCNKECDIKNAACAAGVSSQVITGDIVGALGGEGGCIYQMWDCEDSCNKQGGPCCSVQCQTGTCCGGGEFCCGGLGGSPPGCCANGSVCVSGEVSAHGYSYCCPAGSDPAGCHTGSGFGEWVFDYCRGPGQTCCGMRACDKGTFCADVGNSFCCTTGWQFCYGSCCNGTCITQTAEFGWCCENPNTVWGAAAARRAIA
jgi:hypothetical protein